MRQCDSSAAVRRASSFGGIAAFQEDFPNCPTFSELEKSENLGLRFSELGKIFRDRKILEDFREDFRL